MSNVFLVAFFGGIPCLPQAAMVLLARGIVGHKVPAHVFYKPWKILLLLSLPALSYGVFKTPTSVESLTNGFICASLLLSVGALISVPIMLDKARATEGKTLHMLPRCVYAGLGVVCIALPPCFTLLVSK